MVKSMTGFATATLQTAVGTLYIELSSVNKRFFDVSLQMPKELNFVETQIKRYLRSLFYRGSLSMKVFFLQEEAVDDIQKALLETRDLWKEYAKLLAIDSEQITLSFLLKVMQQPKALSISMKESLLKAFYEAIDTAKSSFDAMREKEGQFIQKELDAKLAQCESFLKEIQQLQQAHKQQLKPSLQKKMQDILQQQVEEERIFKEAALLAEKTDVDEEITRFFSHVEQMKDFLQKERTGKKIDFLLQEMFREVNTITGKAQNATTAQKCVEIKVLLEQMREQVQNVE